MITELQMIELGISISQIMSDYVIDDVDIAEHDFDMTNLPYAFVKEVYFFELAGHDFDHAGRRGYKAEDALMRIELRRERIFQCLTLLRQTGHRQSGVLAVIPEFVKTYNEYVATTTRKAS